MADGIPIAYSELLYLLAMCQNPSVIRATWLSLFCFSACYGLVYNKLFPSPAHVVEACLLITSLRLFSTNQYYIALGLSLIACLFKPSIPYLFVVLYSVVIALKCHFSLRRVILAVVPAASMALLIIIQYRLQALIDTQIPLRAKQAFATLNLGFFFGEGKYLWAPPGANIKFYIGTPGSSYVFILLIIAYYLGVIVLRPRLLNSKHVLVASITGIVHIIFILYFYGYATSYLSYSYFAYAICGHFYPVLLFAIS